MLCRSLARLAQW